MLTRQTKERRGGGDCGHTKLSSVAWILHATWLFE